MNRFDQDSGDCFVFTYKEGLLSLVAHDLKIRVTRFSLEVDETARTVEGTFAADSLRVVCAMDGDDESPGSLSADQKREIEGNIVRDVLAAAKYPEVCYRSTAVAVVDGGFAVEGELSLHGQRRPLAVALRPSPDGYVASARVHQPDFGIRPYSALFGTLKVQADVVVRVHLPRPKS